MPGSKTYSVFAYFVDVTPYPGTIINANVSDGDFAYCYVGATDEHQATEKLRADLKQRGLRLDNIQWCMRHESPEAKRSDLEHEDVAVRAAWLTDAVVYDRIDPVFHRDAP